MKEMTVYYCSLALKDLRKAKSMTVEQLADLIPCSTRTVNRFESCNWTSNLQTAQKVAEIFSIPFDRLFIPVDQHLLEALKLVIPAVPFGKPQNGTTYYSLYIRRISLWDANIWGRTKWIGPYDHAHELRILRKLSAQGVNILCRNNIPVINRQDEWDSFFYRSTIGYTYQVIISKECLEICLPYTLCPYAVPPYALHTSPALEDIILLGDYKNAPEIFSVRC